MRDIKFRAWVKEDEIMVAPCTPRFNTLGLFCGVLFKEIQRQYDVEEVELMQYTGLKDKNGKEIYEGDIVDTTSQKYLVQNGDPTYYPNGIPSREVKWITSQHHNGWNIYYPKRSQYEVIGNIYENGNLL